MMIVAENLTKQFNDCVAVRGLNLQVAEGQLVALLGPNGAGKTTTIRMLSAILKPTAGSARVAGFDVVRDAVLVRHAVGLLTEFHGLYLRMNALEYLDFFGSLHNVPQSRRRARIEALLRQFELWDDRGRRLGEFSKGMRQKVALVRAMIHDPQVLFLDEPTSAMDPHSAKLVRDSIAQLKQEGRTIFICTHNLAEAEALADRIAIIRRGEIVADGSVAELEAQLLGAPTLEVRFAKPVNGLLPELRQWVEVIEADDDHIRYRTPDPERLNPSLIAWLMARGAAIVTLSEVPRSLEEIYLAIVEGARPSVGH